MGTRGGRTSRTKKGGRNEAIKGSRYEINYWSRRIADFRN